LRPSHSRHGAEALGRQQDLIAHPGVHRIQGHYGLPAVAAVEIERLHQEQLPAFVARMLLSGYQFADDARNQHDWPLLGSPAG